MNLSIVFPAFNEEGNVERAVEGALSFLKEKGGEVIVVNDGSSDRTEEILDDLSIRYSGKLRVIHHGSNRGYAAALSSGFSAAKGDWIFYSDSDNQFDMKEIRKLTKIANGADIVAGFRIRRTDPIPRRIGAKAYNWIVRLLLGIATRDIDCAFKLFRRSVFERIKIESSGFAVDAEILAKAQALGMVVRQVGVTHYPRKVGRSTVRLKHLFETILKLIEIRRRLRG